MRAGGGVRLAPRGGGGGEGGGCSTSRCGPALPSFSRLGGGPGPDLEPHGLPTSDDDDDDDDDDSSASTVSREDDDGDGELEVVKEDRWVQRPRPTRNPVLCSTGECQDQRHPLGALFISHGRKDRKQRTTSLDLGFPGGVHRSSTNSPGFFVSGVGAMNKGLGVSPQSRSGVLTSPGTLSYNRRGTAVAGYQQGWTSERVPLPSNGHIRHPGGGSMALPYNNGRVLPSKWEDAERWIFSPNSTDALAKTSAVPHARRPKAKSGPLGPPGRLGGQYSSVSSSVSLFDSGRVGHLTANSPFLAGVLIPEHYCGGKSNVGKRTSGTPGDEFSIGIVGRSSLANSGSPAIQYTRVRRRLDTAVDSSASLPTTQESTQDEQIESIEDSASIIIPTVSRKDTATQTSPELSRSSSPSARPSFARSFSMQQARERESRFSDVEIRDVQMDDRVTLTRWSKKHVTPASNKNAANILEWNKKMVDSKSPSWKSTEAAYISKVEKEEAKIAAWENLQKAKAEAAIQKLVMKLEKKRSSSLERILSTLRSAQRKAQGMRDEATASQDEQLSRKVKKTSHATKNGQIRSLSGCFTCHTF